MKKPHRARYGNREENPSPIDGAVRPAGLGLNKFLMILRQKVRIENCLSSTFFSIFTQPTTILLKCLSLMPALEAAVAPPALRLKTYTGNV